MKNCEIPVDEPVTLAVFHTLVCISTIYDLWQAFFLPIDAWLFFFCKELLFCDFVL